MGGDRDLARLRMRSWRRGTKEMDLILGRFADAELTTMEPETRQIYETLLAEPDTDLYRWITGRDAPPPAFADIVARIAARAEDGSRGGHPT